MNKENLTRAGLEPDVNPEVAGSSPALVKFSLFIQIYLKSVPSQFPLWFIKLKYSHFIGLLITFDAVTDILPKARCILALTSRQREILSYKVPLNINHTGIT